MPADAEAPLAGTRTTAAERQSALLSLLYPATSSAIPASQAPVHPAPPPAQQEPTPPASVQRTGQSPNTSETQGKLLLEQLMGG